MSKDDYECFLGECCQVKYVKFKDSSLHLD